MKLYFIDQLIAIINDPSNVDIIRWHDDDGFIILDRDRMEREVIPKNFKTARYTSFIRQLINYGFRRSVRAYSGACVYVQTSTKFGKDIHDHINRRCQKKASKRQREEQQAPLIREDDETLLSVSSDVLNPKKTKLSTSSARVVFPSARKTIPSMHAIETVPTVPTVPTVRNTTIPIFPLFSCPNHDSLSISAGFGPSISTSSSTSSCSDPNHSDPNHSDPNHSDPNHSDPNHSDPNHSDPSCNLPSTVDSEYLYGSVYSNESTLRSDLPVRMLGHDQAQISNEKIKGQHQLSAYFINLLEEFDNLGNCQSVNSFLLDPEASEELDEPRLI